MTARTPLRAPYAAVALLALLAPLPARADEATDAGQIAISVGQLLERGHYSRLELDDAISRRLLANYLEALDYNRLFFTQEDINVFSGKYATSLNDDILLGNPNAAFDIFDIYKKRVEDRVAWIKERLKSEQFTFDSNRTIERDRSKAPWPADPAAADALWRDRIEGELLQARLNEAATDPPVKAVTRRFDQLLRNVREMNSEDVLKTFLNTLAQTYDPHSEYLSKADLENFSIGMSLSLVGIGAVLKSDEGYAKIVDLVPGGPAERSGRLKVGDRIAAVAQGRSPFVDTVDMKLDKVVALIRGKKNTLVRLQVVPRPPADPAKRKVVEIVRDTIQLKDQEARAEIIESPNADGAAPLRLGWITLPSFYADLEKIGTKGAKSTTDDVAALIKRLKTENTSGLVIDLRSNGGGSLEEAIRLTGLFIKKGPVVQVKDSNGNIRVQADSDPSVAYEGPLVVLTNRLSASASEIFAAALQDYGRAVIVGDGNSFGKGTVQTMVHIGKFIPFLGTGSDGAGALKLTIQKFYRIAGGSTQLRGVQSDIRLPSLFDQEDIGESSLKMPLPYDEVPAAKFQRFTTDPLPIQELRARSNIRVASDPEFRYVAEDVARLKEQKERNAISLSEATRKAEKAAEKARREAHLAARKARGTRDEAVYVINLEDVNKPQLKRVTAEDLKAKQAKAKARQGDDESDEENGEIYDAVRNETLAILRDLVSLSRTPKTASAQTATATP